MLCVRLYVVCAFVCCVCVCMLCVRNAKYDESTYTSNNGITSHCSFIGMNRYKSIGCTTLSHDSFSHFLEHTHWIE